MLKLTASQNRMLRLIEHGRDPLTLKTASPGKTLASLERYALVLKGVLTDLGKQALVDGMLVAKSCETCKRVKTLSDFSAAFIDNRRCDACRKEIITS